MLYNIVRLDIHAGKGSSNSSMIHLKQYLIIIIGGELIMHVLEVLKSILNAFFDKTESVKIDLVPVLEKEEIRNL